MPHPVWKPAPEDHDCPAAAAHLALVAAPEAADALVAALRSAPVSRQKAKDILRASCHLDENNDIPCRIAALDAAAGAPR